MSNAQGLCLPPPPPSLLLHPPAQTHLGPQVSVLGQEKIDWSVDLCVYLVSISWYADTSANQVEWTGVQVREQTSPRMHENQLCAQHYWRDMTLHSMQTITRACVQSLATPGNHLGTHCQIPVTASMHRNLFLTLSHRPLASRVAVVVGWLLNVPATC